MSYHKRFCLDSAIREIEIEHFFHKVEDKVWVTVIAEKNNYQLFKSLLPYYSDTQATDSQGNTVLHILVDGNASKHKYQRKDRDALFRNLVSKGLDIHQQNRHGWAPIHYAAKYCHIEMLKTAKTVDADFALKTTDGETPLLLVCKNILDTKSSSKENKIIDLFMTCQCDINAIDVKGYSALHYAVRNCSVKTVKKLLKNGADVSILTKDHWLSPLYFAIVHKRNLALVKILLNAGASLELQGMSILGGSINIVKYLIKKGVVMNYPEKVLQLTPLQIAIYQEHRDLLKLLIDEGADVDGRGKEGFTPLHLSAMRGYLEFTMVLIARGAEVNCRSNDQFTPLHLLTMKSHIEKHWVLLGTNDITYGHETSSIIKLLSCRHPPIPQSYEAVLQLLLRRGIDVNALSSNGWSSLHFAAKTGRHKASFVKTLLDYGANVNYKVPNSGYTALHFASENDFEDIAKVLIDGGADMNALTRFGQTPVHLALEPSGMKVLKLLIKCGANIDGSETDSQVTPLNLVLEKKYDSTAKILISAGANVNRVTWNGYSPIHLALELTGTDVLELLIKHGADVNYRQPHTRMMPLHVAVQKKNGKQVSILIKAGADVNALTSNGKSPLSLALTLVQFNFSDTILIDILILLTASGADVNYKDPVLRLNPLKVAFKIKRFDIMKILIDAGADANVLAPDESPVHWALKSFGSEDVLIDVLKSMVHHGADINHIEPYSQLTPLHVALKSNRIELVGILIEEGADVNALTPDDKTPMHLALESNCKQGMNLLVRCHVKLNCTRRRCVYTLMYIAAQNRDEDLIDNLVDLDKTPLLLTIDTQEKREMRKRIFCLSALADASNKKSCLPVYYEINNYCKETSACEKNPHKCRAYSQFMSYQVLSGGFHELSDRQVMYSNYLSMLDAINLPVHSISPGREYQICHYDMQCLDEVKRLKNYWISDGVTLYRLFHMTPRRRRLYINNLDFSVIESEFKIYYKLISAHYYENKIKDIIMEAVQSAFCKLINAYLPIVCIDEIFWNLSIVDIIATIEAAETTD